MSRARRAGFGLLTVAAVLAVGPQAHAAPSGGTIYATVTFDAGCDNQRDPFVDVGVPNVALYAKNAAGANVGAAVSDQYGRATVDVPAGQPLTMYYFTLPSARSGFRFPTPFTIAVGASTSKLVGFCPDQIDAALVNNAAHTRLRGDVPVTGDWDGDGRDTPGIFRDGTWFLRNSNSPGGVDITFSWGATGDYPIVGDWDGDGKDTIGVYRSGEWFVRNSNSGGTVDGYLDARSVDFNGTTRATPARGDIPVVGDWDGDGKDNVGTYRQGAWTLSQWPALPGSLATFQWGGVGDIPVVGDWDGNGTDGIGVDRRGTWYERQTATPGPVDATFEWGIYPPWDVPLVGDWDKDGTDTIGVSRDTVERDAGHPIGQQWLLRNSNSGGPIDVNFSWGYYTFWS